MPADIDNIRVLFPKNAKCSQCGKDKPVCCADMHTAKCKECCAHAK